jgi:transcriptional regulator GlxA family with amidase domain
VPAERYRQIVERADAARRANSEQSFGIGALSRIVEVEPRTLARALHAIHGTTPSGYLRAARLSLAREALLEPNTRGKTVTEVAMRFGFRELRRFAGEYRTASGESPSETLRRSVTNS